MRHKALVLSGIIIALLTIGFFSIRNTPHYSLYLLKKAVENHDPDEALKYINIDSIVDSLAKSFFGKDWEKAGEGAEKRPSLKRMVADALPDIKASIKSSFRTSIAARNEENRRENTAVQRDKKLAPIENVKIEGLDLRKLKETSLWNLVIERDGGVAMVSLKDHPGIRAKMVQTSTGHWQVVEIISSSQPGQIPFTDKK